LRGPIGYIMGLHGGPWQSPYRIDIGVNYHQLPSIPALRLPRPAKMD
jgi:hypothetical protein